MEHGSVGEERDPQGVPAGTERGGDVRLVCTDSSADAMALRLAEVDDMLHKKHKVLAQLQYRREMLNMKKKEQDELRSRYYILFKTKNAEVCLQADEGQSRQMEKLQREQERLKEEYAELTEKTQQQQHQVKSHKKYQDYMEQAARMTEFEDVMKLTLQLENQLHFRDQLTQKYIKGQEQAHQCKKMLWMLEEQSNLLQLHKISQLTQLQNELQTTHSETLTWEKQWNQINEMAAKKTLLLGKITLGTLNLYEKTHGTVDIVNINDTEKQLDEIKIWIQDHVSMITHKDHIHIDGGGRKRKKEKRDKAKGSQ